MRLLVLPLLLLAPVFAAKRAPEPPRPLVILVHGRGMAGADSAAMRAVWTQDLDSALASAGFPPLADGAVRLAWYADVMDPSVSAACSRPYRTEAGLADIARGFLAGLVSVIPDSGSEQDRDARSLFGDMLYLVDPTTRCAAETRFENALSSARAQRRPVIVVAYSLGAAVAYGHLQRDTIAADVQLITLGSPLEIPNWENGRWTFMTAIATTSPSAIGTGTGLSVVVPSPRRPCVLPPQAQTVPSLLSARL